MFVQHDSYVLPLLWRGTPVKMSCPVTHIQPQAAGPTSLCCSPYGMTVKVQGLSATEELKVKGKRQKFKQNKNTSFKYL